MTETIYPQVAGVRSADEYYVDFTKSKALVRLPDYYQPYVVKDHALWTQPKDSSQEDSPVYAEVFAARGGDRSRGRLLDRRFFVRVVPWDESERKTRLHRKSTLALKQWLEAFGQSTRGNKPALQARAEAFYVETYYRFSPEFVIEDRLAPTQGEHPTYWKTID